MIINCSADASGAWAAGERGDVVVIVDIIDMSTSLETALEHGALAVFGASPDKTNAPVSLNPFLIGEIAGKKAKDFNSSIIIIAEPRWGNDANRLHSCQLMLNGLKNTGINSWELVPNLGATVAKLVDFKNKIVIAVTHSGGVAFDAAFNAGGKVLTATTARTGFVKSADISKKGVARACKIAKKFNKNLTFIAASSQSLEDVLGAQYLMQLALSKRNNNW